MDYPKCVFCTFEVNFVDKTLKLVSTIEFRTLQNAAKIQ